MTHLHQKLSALVDGELTGAARERAIKHLRKCAACRRELDETLALKARLSGLPDFEPSPDLFVSLDGVGSGAGVADEHSTDSRSRPVVRRILIGAGSVSVAVLSIAYVVGGPDEPTTPAVSPPVDTLRAEFGGTAGDDLLTDAVVPGVRAEQSATTPVASKAPTGGADAALKLQAAVALPVIAAGDDRRAVAALKRVARATRSFSFTGVRKVEALDADQPVRQTIDVEHVPGQGTTIEVQGTDETAFLPDDDGTDSRLDALAASYDLAVLAPAQLLGRPTTVIGVGRDGAMVAKVWIDDQSGLMLKRELYEDDRVVRASEYVSIDISRGTMFLNHLAPEIASTASPLDTSDATRFSDAGWACPASLGDGFQLTGLMQVDAGGEVMHAEYTDGLSSVSVFSERGRLDPSRLAGFAVADQDAAEPVYVRSGLPTVAVWESDSTVYAVVSDAPAATVTALVGALPHTAPAEPGISGRVGTGLDRMAGFLTPLG